MDLFYLENIKAIMKFQNKKQSDLAKELNVKPTTVSKYLNGTRMLKIDDLIKICQFLNTTPDDILDFK